MIKAREESGKPFLMVNIPGLDERYARRFLSHNVPFFQSAERAIMAYSRLRESYRLRRAIFER
jgi:acyl-CoA synthetase (NDP forming)